MAADVEPMGIIVMAFPTERSSSMRYKCTFKINVDDGFLFERAMKKAFNTSNLLPTEEKILGDVNEQIAAQARKLVRTTIIKNRINDLMFALDIDKHYTVEVKDEEENDLNYEIQFIANGESIEHYLKANYVSVKKLITEKTLLDTKGTSSGWQKVGNIILYLKGAL